MFQGCLLIFRILLVAFYSLLLISCSTLTGEQYQDAVNERHRAVDEMSRSLDGLPGTRERPSGPLMR